MEAFREVEGRAIPYGAKNVDTDVIIPAHWLKTITREGLGRGAFETVRARGDSVFDDPEFAGAPILIAGDTTFELDKSFMLTLGTPTGGVLIGDGSGLGTITNDDAPPPVQNVWINEINYDPSGNPDTGEFLEIAGLAGVDLTTARLRRTKLDLAGAVHLAELHGALVD